MRTIDLEDWPRRNSFEFFNRYDSPQFSICANVTITRTYEYLRENDIHRFTAFLWLICHAANKVAELRYRVQNNEVIEYTRVHPSFTWLNDDNSLTFCLAEYTEDTAQFFKNVDTSVVGIEPNPIAADKQTAHNVLYISCVPWLNFTSISHPSRKDDTCSIPRITWGKFTKEHDQWTMPVSIELHHGLADGYHAGQFYHHLQQLLDEPANINWQK